MTVQVLQAAVTLFVASRVSPQAFALVGIASVVFNLQFLVRESLGLGQALIYVEDDGLLQEAVDGSFLVTAGLGCLIASVTFAGAPLFAKLFTLGFIRSDVANVVRVMSLFLLFVAVGHIPQSVLERFHDFRTRAVVEMAAVVTYAGVAVVLLQVGLGVWSIVLARPAQGAVLAIGCWIATPIKPRIPPRIHRGTLGALVRYGRFLGGVSVLGFAMSSLDNVIMGWLAGGVALGAYALAYTVTNAAPTLITQTVNKVFFPLFSRFRKDREALSLGFAGAVHWASVAILPATVGLLTVVPDALVALFGPEWRAAGAFVTVLALYGLARTVGTLGNSLLASVGRPELTFWASVVAVGVSLALLWPLSQFGAVGIVWAYTLGQLASAIFSIAHTRHWWIRRLATNLGPPLVVTLLSLLVGLLVGRALPGGDTRDIGAMLALGFCYPPLLWLIDARFRASVAGLMGRERTPGQRWLSLWEDKVRCEDDPARDARCDDDPDCERAGKERPLRICYFGFFDPGYPRNAILRRGLEAKRDVELVECRVPAGLEPGHYRGEGMQGFGLRRLLFEVDDLGRTVRRIVYLTRCYLRLPKPIDAIVVAEFNQGAVPLAKALGVLSDTPVIADFLVSLYEEAVLLRKTLRRGRPRARYRRLIDALTVKFADRLILDCEPQIDFYDQLFPGLAAKAAVVPIGAPTWDFPVVRLRSRRAADPFRVIFYGFVTPLHGLDTILRAADALARDGRFEFEVVGAGSLYDQLCSDFQDVPSVSWRGAMPVAELRRAIASSDVCLGLFGQDARASRVVPNKVWQGLSMGRPVVTGDGPGPRSIFVDGEHLLLVPLGDPESLAAALRLLADDPDLAARLAQAGCDLVRSQFTSTPLACRLVRLVRDLAQERTVGVG